MAWPARKTQPTDRVVSVKLTKGERRAIKQAQKVLSNVEGRQMSQSDVLRYGLGMLCGIVFGEEV